MRRATTGLWLAVAAYGTWGLLAPVAKLLLEHFTPIWLNALRTGLACLLFLPLMGPRLGEAFALLRRPRILGLILVGGGLSFLLFQYSLVHQDATYTTLGFYTAPVWTAVLARTMLGERLGNAFLPAVAGLSGGAWLALMGLDGRLAGAHGFGMLLAVLSGVAWAVYTVELRRHAPDVRLRPLVLATFLASFAFFAVLAPLVHVFTGTEPLPSLALPWTAWGWMAVLVAGPSLASVLLFKAAVQRAPAALVNVLVGVELASTVFFAWLILGDTFDAWRLLGIGVVLASVSTYLWLQARPQPTPATPV